MSAWYAMPGADIMLSESLTLYVCEVCGASATDTEDVEHYFGSHKINGPNRFRAVRYVRDSIADKRCACLAWPGLGLPPIVSGRCPRCGHARQADTEETNG